MYTLFVPSLFYKPVINLLKDQKVAYTVLSYRSKDTLYLSLPKIPPHLIMKMLEGAYNCRLESDKDMNQKYKNKFRGKPIQSLSLSLLLLSLVLSPSASAEQLFISSPRKVERSPENEAKFQAYKERKANRRYAALAERKRLYDEKKERMDFYKFPAYYKYKNPQESTCYAVTR